MGLYLGGLIFGRAYWKGLLEGYLHLRFRGLTGITIITFFFWGGGGVLAEFYGMLHFQKITFHTSGH